MPGVRTGRRRPLRVVAVASPHGYGHAAIVTAVLRALRARCPDLEVIMQSAAPRRWLAERIGGPLIVEPVPAEADFGLIMRSSVGVLVEESLTAYRRAHAGWPGPVHRQAERLAVWRPDLVVASASYTALAAARRLGVPAVGLGPFCWLDMAAAYLGDRPEGRLVLEQMAQAYAAMDAFLLTEPAVAPTRAPAVVPVGPVGLPAASRRAALAAAVNLRPGERLVLVSMGGYADSSPVAGWKPIPGWRMVEPDAVRAAGLTVSEAIASVDVVLTKPGYGTYVEAACTGTAILSRARPDWPESEGLARWYSGFGSHGRIDDETFLLGDLERHLQMLVTQGPARRLFPRGNQEAADFLLSLLS